MIMRLSRVPVCCLVSMFLLGAVGGCPKDEETKTATSVAADRATQSDGQAEAKPEAKLAKADALDGKVDKIVTRCASCALGMDGKPEHAHKALDYTLYFCTEKCAETFAKNMTESIMSMEIPARPAAKESTKADVKMPSEVDIKLAKADLLDGKADKIVTRCASCALNMDGKPKHALKVMDYTMYFCTKGCAERFAKHTTESVLGMKIPED